MVTPVRIGILYSTTGAYGAFGRECRDGAELAAERLVREGVPVELVIADPEGEAGRYVSLARELLRDKGCRHIVGTALSAARKDVAPLVEKHDALLWYICPYEGFEANENIIYTGACPAGIACRTMISVSAWALAGVRLAGSRSPHCRRPVPARSSRRRWPSGSSTAR